MSVFEFVPFIKKKNGSRRPLHLRTVVCLNKIRAVSAARYLRRAVPGLGALENPGALEEMGLQMSGPLALNGQSLWTGCRGFV